MTVYIPSTRLSTAQLPSSSSPISRPIPRAVNISTVVLEDDLDASLYAVRDKNVDVTFMVDPTNDRVNEDATDHRTYSAASTQTLTFRFIAEGTAIRKGTVSFEIPKGWTKPVGYDKDKDPAGELTATQYDSLEDLGSTDYASPCWC